MLSVNLQTGFAFNPLKIQIIRNRRVFPFVMLMKPRTTLYTIKYSFQVVSKVFILKTKNVWS